MQSPSSPDTQCFKVGRQDLVHSAEQYIMQLAALHCIVQGKHRLDMRHSPGSLFTALRDRQEKLMLELLM